MDELNKDEQLLFLKIKSDVSESIDKRVSEHLERDRSLIKSTVSTVSKIFIWVIGAFSVALTILGIKTYKDIKSAIKDTAKTSIESKLSKTDILKQYDNKAKTLYLNSLVESLLLRIEKNKYKRFSRKELSDENAIFLIKGLEDNNIDVETFRGILNILGEMRYKQDINENLIEVIKTILSPEFNIISYRVEKLKTLFNELINIEKEQFKKIAKRYLRNTEEIPSVRIASMKYLKKIRDFDIISDLETLSKSKNEELKNESIASLAYLDFTNDLVKNYITENKKGKMNLNKAANILNITIESLNGFYSKSGNGFFNKPNETKEKNYKKSSSINIKHLIDNGVRFTFSNFSFRDEKPDLSIFMYNNTSSFVGVDKDLFFKYHIENDILSGAKNSLADFSKYLNGINGSDNKRREEKAKIIASVNDTTFIDFIDFKIKSSDINSNILLELNKNKKLIAKWWDYTGRLIKKEVKNINNFEQFKLASKETIINNDIWWK